MIDDWSAAARLIVVVIVLVWGCLLAVPALIYAIRRSVARSEIAERRDRYEIDASYRIEPPVRSANDDD